jgi:predicted nucleotidyltransferase
MLTNLLGSRLRAKLLGWLFSHPDERYFVRQLTGLLGEDSTNMSRELARLEKMGILVSTREGRQRYYRANKQCAIFSELCGLAIKTTGVTDVLRKALAPMSDQIRSAFVYGSMAKGTATSVSDVDLLVAGDLDETALHLAVTQAEQQLGRTVNYSLLSQTEFQRRRQEKKGFLARVLAGPMIVIIGSTHEI